MARNRRRKGSYVALPVDTYKAVGALADDTITDLELLGTLSEDLFLISAELSWALNNHTAGEGPIMVGLADSDYSITEIGECLDATPLTPDDRVAMERVRRKVRRVGSFPGLATEEVLEDGVQKKTPLKWATGTGLQLFVKNNSGSVLTTGSFVRVWGTIHARWIR